jgi:hypothetical protein
MDGQDVALALFILAMLLTVAHFFAPNSDDDR